MDLFAAEIGDGPGRGPPEEPAARRSPSRTRNGCGAAYDSGDYPAALDTGAGGGRLRRAARRAGRRGGRAATRVQLGIGLSVYVEITGGGVGGRRPERERHGRGPPGRHRPRSSPAPRRTARATPTAWAMLASEELGIPVERITVQVGRHRPRSPRAAAPAARAACSRAAPRCGRPPRSWSSVARQRAADELEADPADLVVDREPRRRSRVRRRRPARRCRFARARRAGAAVRPQRVHRARRHLPVRRARRRRRGRRRDRQGRAACGSSRVDDAGTVINPLLAEGQRHGGIAQGAAQALLEEVRLRRRRQPDDDDASPTTRSSRATELPSFELVDHRDADPLQPAGRQGHRRGRHHRRHPRGAERRRRRRRATSASGTSTCPRTPMRVWRAVAAARG